VPLPALDDVPLALVLLRSRGSRPYSMLSVELAARYAEQAGLALGFAAADRDRRRIAVFEDRDRIARDLHDLVIQRLFATGLGLQGLAPQLRDEAAATRLEGYVEDLDATIQDIRSAIYSLHAADRAMTRTRAKLDHVIAEARNVLGFRPTVRVDGPLDLMVTGELAADLVAVAREALSNVVRHANASTVDIEVKVTTDALSLMVDDDGGGLPQQLNRRSGLANLSDRAERHGGAATLTTSPHGGTRLLWRVPL
jgi:signal transduction histidine kinase